MGNIKPLLIKMNITDTVASTSKVKYYRITVRKIDLCNPFDVILRKTQTGVQ